MPVTRITIPLLTVLTLVSFGCGGSGGSITGRWNAVVKTADGVPIPFRLDLESDGHNATGYFFDGDRRIASNSGSFHNGALQLHFDTYDADLNATLRQGLLDGNYTVHRGAKNYPRQLTATRAPNNPVAGIPASDALKVSGKVSGDWLLHGNEDGKPVAWTLIIRQNGADVSGAIQRLDGDTGTLTGSFKDGKLAMSHFSGARPALLEGQLMPDGTFDLTLNRKTKLLGVRTAEAQAKGIPGPPDPSQSTAVKNPAEPFHFSAPDLTGQTVSSSSKQFRDKVVVLSIGGSWCPNCMDEAPFLVDLYNKYHSQGLEIVALEFEYGDETYNRKRIQSFVDRYKIPYTVLSAGTTDQVEKKLPQLVNFGAFPTTVFIGRDGKVKSIHDGFASVATGVEHQKLKQETDETVEHLLANQPLANAPVMASVRP